MGLLTSIDTFLSPENFTPKLLGIVSDWIDLCSPDPVIYNVSRQVLKLEVAFASFCGLAALSLPTPSVGNGHRSAQAMSLYANAVKEILDSSPAQMSFSVRMPMMDTIVEDERASNGLEHLTRPEHTELIAPSRHDARTAAHGQESEKQVVRDHSTNGLDASRSSVDSSRKRIRVHDFLGSWDTWNTLRTFCGHHSRLHLGKSPFTYC